MSINSSIAIEILIQMALEYMPVRIPFFVSLLPSFPIDPTALQFKNKHRLS